MGIQDVQDVAVIRHACVHIVRLNQGIGGILLDMLREKAIRLVLIGTWAVHFYEKHVFRLVSPAEKN